MQLKSNQTPLNGYEVEVFETNGITILIDLESKEENVNIYSVELDEDGPCSHQKVNITLKEGIIHIWRKLTWEPQVYAEFRQRCKNE